VRVLDEYFQALRTQDWKRLEACLAEDVCRTGPYIDVVRGRRAYVEFLSNVVPKLQNYELRVQRVRKLDAGSALVELCEIADIDGVRTEHPEALLFDFYAAGAILRIDIYLKQPPRRLSAKHGYVPEGWHPITPRIAVDRPEELVRFVKLVFGAAGEYRSDRPAELRIGESILMISGASAREVMTAFLYVYVEDADASYRRALDAGATSIEAPRETPYGDRRAMVRDAWGNTWQIATHRGRSV
jgi:PhnB protein